MADRAPFFARPGAMLVGSHDRRVDHGVFIVGIVCQDLEKTLPNAAYGPAGETLVRVAPAAKTFRQIAPRRPHSELPDHGFDEKTIAQFAVAADRAGDGPATNARSGRIGRLAMHGVPS
jgi:hypothetical protein